MRDGEVVFRVARAIASANKPECPAEDRRFHPTIGLAPRDHVPPCPAAVDVEPNAVAARPQPAETIDMIVEYLNKNVRNAQLVLKDAVKRVATKNAGLPCLVPAGLATA